MLWTVLGTVICLWSECLKIWNILELLLWESANNRMYICFLSLQLISLSKMFFFCISAFKNLKYEEFLKIAAETVVTLHTLHTLHTLSKCYVNFTILIIISQITSVVWQFWSYDDDMSHLESLAFWTLSIILVKNSMLLFMDRIPPSVWAANKTQTNSVWPLRWSCSQRLRVYDSKIFCNLRLFNILEISLSIFVLIFMACVI